jgi:anti-anti-sigma factor
MIDLQIAVRREANRTVLTVAGELDLATGDALAARLGERDAVDGDLVIDLSQLRFIDASGLRALVTAHRIAEQRGRRFSVARTSPSLDRLLALTGAGGQLGLGETD